MRVLQLLRELMENKRHDRHSAAELLGVQPSAADRYLRLLLKHVPGIRKVAGQRGLTLLFDGIAAHDAPTYSSAIAVCLSASLARLFEGSIYERTMVEALHYLIKRTKRRDAFKELGNLPRKFFFIRQGGEVALPEHAGRLDDLIELILQQRCAVIRYQDFSGNSEEYTLEPLSLAIYDHQLYLLGRDAHRRVRLFRFSRITDVTETSSTFEYPATTEFDPEQRFAGSFGVFLCDENVPVEHVELHLHKRWATHASTHRWHRSQQVTQHDDHVVVHLRVGRCPEFVAWILGFGDEAEVIKPEGLRCDIAERAARLAKKYAPDG